MYRKILLLVLLFLVGSLSSQAKKPKVAENGLTVKVDYTGKLTDGRTFDSSKGGEPLTFVLGAGKLLPKFEEAVRGMKIGQEKLITLKAKEAYGDYERDKIIEVPTSKIPADIKAGETISLRMSYGNVPARLIDKGDDVSHIDTNHFLAGKDLVFNIKLVDILESPAIQP